MKYKNLEENDWKPIIDYINEVTNKNLIYINDKEAAQGEINKVLKVILMVVGLNTIITICGFYILNIDNAFMLGIVCGILDIIPIVGTIFVFAPLILYNVSMGSYIIAVGLVLLYILLIFYSKIIETKFMSDKLNIHPLPMIIAIYIGMKFMGLIGIVMGVFYVVTINELLLVEGKGEKVEFFL